MRRVVDRFTHLLTKQRDSLSDRDLVAHFSSIEPVYLVIVDVSEGGIGLELRDGGSEYLREYNDFDRERMSQDEPLLTAAIDRQLQELSYFCDRLIAIAVNAPLALADCSHG